MASIASLSTAPGTATWTRNSALSSSSFMVSCEEKKKKKSVGDRMKFVSRHRVGKGRRNRIGENHVSLSLFLRGGGLFFTRGSVNIAK
jgi:hypothetical protein